MNVYAWLSLASSLTSGILGIIVYSINRKRLLNKLFLLTACAGVYWTFTEFMMWQSSNADIAQFWNKMGFLWPFFAVLVINFALVYTESNWLKNKLTYVLLYAPAVIFALTDLTTDLINGPPVMQYWGYEDTVPTGATWMYDLSTFWVALLPTLALLACIVFTFRTKDERKRRQSKFVTVGFAIPIVTYIVTNIGFPAFNIDVPNLGHIAVAFFGGFVGYAIVKYELFTFDAAMAAENIVSTMPDSLVLADMGGKMLRVNKRLVDFLGYVETEVVGRSIVELCVDADQCRSVLRELAEKRITRNFELGFKTKFGEEKHVLFSGSVVHSKTGRDIGITCVIHDITERKQMEERLVKAERLASIGELAGQVGHDLRNPLTGIKGGAYFLRKKGDKLTEADREKILDSIENAVEDSNRIIKSLVEYSRDLSLERDPCTPKSLLSYALSQVQIPDSITLLDHTAAEPELFTDVTKMESVFMSIIQNAVDAITANGTIEVRSMLKDSNVEIAFIDSGVGIPEGVLLEIFSPLTTTKAKGMGLGLAICKRIVDAHGGKIAVESAVGKGTTVIITLLIQPKIEFMVENGWMAPKEASVSKG
jgi:PAS domain S-box-containing protein